MMSGARRWLSVTRVTVVSVNVDLVIVSVQRPRAEGGGGSTTPAPGRSTVTRTLPSRGGWCSTARGPPRKWAGIIAWNSSFVIGRDGCIHTFNTLTSVLDYKQHNK